MIDPSHTLIQELYEVLNGAVTYDGTTIPVYTRLVEWSSREADELIQIGEIRFSEVGPKDRLIYSGLVELYIDTFFTGKNEGSAVPVNDISSQVCNLINTTFTLSSVVQILGRVESVELFPYELDPQGAVYRKLITYSFIIEDNGN